MAQLITLFTQLSSQFGAWLDGYLYHIALSFVACIIALFGHVINKFVKRLFARQHLIIRTMAFILVTAFGFGALTVYLTPLVMSVFKLFGLVYLPWLVLLAFIILGFIAQRKNQV